MKFLHHFLLRGQDSLMLQGVLKLAYKIFDLLFSVLFSDLPVFQDALKFFRSIDRKNHVEKLNTIDNFHYQDIQNGNNIVNTAIMGMADSDPELLLDVVIFLGMFKVAWESIFSYIELYVRNIEFQSAEELILP